MMWLSTFFSGVVTLVVISWVWFRISNRRFLRICRSIPSAQPCHPVWGNILGIVGSADQVGRNLFQMVNEAVLKGHRAVSFWLGAYPIVLVLDPDDIRKLMNNSVDKGKLWEEMGKGFMEYGLLTAPVDHWKMTRPHLNLSFRPRALKELMPSFNRTSKRLVDALSEHVDGTEVNLLPHVTLAAIKAIAFFNYGVDDMDLKSEVRGVQLATELMVLRIVKPWLRSYFIFKLLYKKELNFVRTSCLTSLQIANDISVKRQASDKSDLLEQGSGNFEHDILTIEAAMRELQKTEPNLKEEHVMDEIVGFFGGGTESMGATVSNCLLALGRLPHIQDKLYEEIRTVVSENDDGEIAYHDLSRLTYLDQVIKETLRMFSPVSFTTRVPNKDLDLNGYTLPANKTAIICLPAASFDPKYFRNPYKFDPDRFSTEKRPEDRVLLPFGKGARNCIGKDYAKLLMKTMIVHVVRKYTISTNTDVEDLKKRFVVTGNCHYGYNVSLKNRIV